MPNRPLRGLIVEDEGPTILLFQRFLKDAGYEIAGIADTGEEAISLAHETQPDFILMDINIPGMKGIEATLEIMTERPVPIVMVTAYNDPEDIYMAKQAGACGYLVKPITSAMLIENIKECTTAFEEGKNVSL